LEIGCNIVDDNASRQVTTEQRKVFYVNMLLSPSVLPVQPVSNEGLLAIVELVHNPVSVVLHRSSENHHFVTRAHVFQELSSAWSDQKVASAALANSFRSIGLRHFNVVNKSLVQIEHKSVPRGVVVFEWGQEGWLRNPSGWLVTSLLMLQLVLVTLFNARDNVLSLVYLLTVRDLLVTLLLFDGQLLLLQGELLQELEENRPHLCDRMLCQIPGKSINDSEDGPVQFSLNKCVFLIFGADLYDQVSDHVIVRGK
jgi:hypothetical protein